MYRFFLDAGARDHPCGALLPVLLKPLPRGLLALLFAADGTCRESLLDTLVKPLLLRLGLGTKQS